jgi:hypothetical protein
MEIDLRFATDVATSAIELKDRHAGIQAQVSKPLVAANDNEGPWPFIPFRKIGMRPSEKRCPLARSGLGALQTGCREFSSTTADKS